MTKCRTGGRTVHSKRIGGLSRKLMANGTEKVVLKPGLEDILLLSEATFVSVRSFAGAMQPLAIDVPLNVDDVVIWSNALIVRMAVIIRVHHLCTN